MIRTAKAIKPAAAAAPSPHGGEGRGEGAPTYQKQPQRRSPLTLAPPVGGRSTSPPRGEVKKESSSPSEPAAPARRDLSAEAKHLAAEIERGIVDGRLDVVAADALQALLAAACRVYTARIEAGERFAPVAKNAVSATDAMVTASGLLRAADLAVFELGMWQGFTGR